MRRSADRFLTTHTGSLPRPPALLESLRRNDRGLPVDGDLPAQVRAAVADVVARQAAAGIAVVNDGEAGKMTYATYVKERLDGFGEEDGISSSMPSDVAEFPGLVAEMNDSLDFAMPACVGPISYRDVEAVRNDLDALEAAARGVQVDELFMSAASPGVVAAFLSNRHYATHEEFIAALADAMKVEYDEIHRAKVLLQVDCPDLAMMWHMSGDITLQEFRRRAELHVEALNHATRDIPADAMRMHLCWGNYEGPHHHDLPLRDIIDIVLRARPAGLCVETANPRHAHEWTVFQETALPGGKVLIPGVVDTTTNYLEHPELVAQRIMRYADLVGAENVIAGTDCGFATFAGLREVDSDIAWAKLDALAAGARIASTARG